MTDSRTVSLVVTFLLPDSESVHDAACHVQNAIQNTPSVFPYPGCISSLRVVPSEGALDEEGTTTNAFRRVVALEDVAFSLGATNGQIALLNRYPEDGDGAEFELVVGDYDGTVVSVAVDASEVVAMGSGLLSCIGDD